jgi:hypothetical protein
MFGHFFLSFVLVLVVLPAIVNAAWNPLDAIRGNRKFNPTYKLLMSKLLEIQAAVDTYMVENSIPYAPSPDYP